jgi:superfamily II DNA/RNA helicase
MPTFGKDSSRAPKGAPRTNTFKPREGGASRAPARDGASSDRRPAFFENRPARAERTEGSAPRTGRDDRGAGGRDFGGERRSFGDRDNRGAPRGAGRDDRAPREVSGGREDRGRDWAPRERSNEGRSFGSRDDRGASRGYQGAGSGDRDNRGGERRSFGDRDSRPSFGDRDNRGSDRGARPAFGDRDNRGGERRSFGDRDSRPAFGDRDSRPAFGDRDNRAGGERRSFGDRDNRGSDRGGRPSFGDRDNRAGGERRSFGDRDNRERRPFAADRDGSRPDRVERDRSRDSSFAGAREGNPNKKAFFEDQVLEKLETADQSEVSTITTFEEMNLHPRLLAALQGMGAETPFPIQQSTIPAAIEGRHVLGRGKTGSGKTIAFSVPVISKLVAAGSQPRKPGKPRALILAPTRELADQIDRTVSALSRAVGFYTCCIYGGVPQRRQEIALSRGVDIVVATPGRLEDLMAQKIIDLSEVETIVIDEADHMCDLGFIEGVRRIMRATGDSQKLLFSATLDREVDALVKEFLPNPYVYEVPNETQETSTIVHRVFQVDNEDRSAVLLRLVQGEGKALIFTRTKMTAESLSESLTQAGVPSARLHGDLNQNQRTRNLERFVKGHVRVLVATDVAARGIHVDDVQLVIQLDPPEEYKTYLHRSGRTGRAGKEGTVITLIPRSRRRRLEDLLRRADRDGIFSDVRPSSELLEQLAGPIAPPPVADVLDFGGGNGGGDRGGRGRDDRGPRRGNFGGNGKGRWNDRPSGGGGRRKPRD